MKYILLLVSIFFISCTEEYGKYNNPRHNYTREEKLSLEYVEDIAFELDSSTINLYTASQYIPNENLYSFMSIDKKILLYDYNRKKMVKEVLLPGLQPSSYEYINKDSIFVLDYIDNSLTIIDSESKIIDSYRINHTIEYYPFPVTKVSPITYLNNSVYIWGNIAGEYVNESGENRRVLLRYNLDSRGASYFVPYPKIYENNWNGTLFRWCYAEYNSNRDIFIISFPADHFLYTYDYKSNALTSYYGGSQYIDATLFSLKDKTEFVDSDMRTKHFVESDSYSKIIYDSYHDIYYRFAELQTVYEGIPGWQKRISIIIFNSNFEIIGEKYVGSLPSIYRYASFVTEKGLHLPKISANEDMMIFSIFKITNTSDNL